MPSALNPADEVCRGLKVKRIVNLNHWISGPKFLCNSKTNWLEDMCLESVSKENVKPQPTIMAIKNLESNDLLPVDRLV